MKQLLRQARAGSTAWLYRAGPAELASAALVVLAGAGIGREAALGMALPDALRAGLALAAAIFVAVMVHVRWAKGVKAQG